ncbi:hypothetical protein [Shewanella sp. GXUN23E]|uniref:hypothetical protein n=1 Tax=Shewanella sp. GXUN23E TaxID=3422498 RepID=UPI003D7C5BEC
MQTNVIKVVLLSGTLLAGNVLARLNELSEQQLGSIRGKYTVSGQDYYFGLLMQTRYLQADGQIGQANMQLEIHSAGLVQVTVAEAVTATDQSMDLNTLGQSAGLQQRIQIGGNANQGLNDLNLAAGQLAALPQGVEVAVGQQWVSSNGEVIYSTQPGQLGMQITLPGAVSVQGLVNTSGSGQLLQTIDLQGSGLGISNLTQLRYAGIDVGSLSGAVLAQQLLGLNY